MALSVVMPALELAQETGRLLTWRKKEGDLVAKGEPLLDVETDKAVVEIESPGDGILAGIKAHAGAVVPVGETIAWLVQPGENAPLETAPAQSGRHPLDPSLRPSSPMGERETEPEVTETRVRLSPKARRLARERGVDIARLRGSGPDGEILAEDILAAGSQPLATVSTQSAAAGSIGRLMAERTVQSWTTIPHFFVVRDIDAGGLVAARERRAPEIQRTRGIELTYTDLLVKSVARALTKHPRVNASWIGDGIRRNPEINIGIAIAVNDGVVVGAIHNADKAKLEDIAADRRELTDAARAGRLRPAQISGATFTISNLGMFHVDAFTAIIVPPQAAILAVGAIGDRVVAVNGVPAVRPMMTITLSGDHRVFDGAEGAAFLNDVVEAVREADGQQENL